MDTMLLNQGRVASFWEFCFASLLPGVICLYGRASTNLAADSERPLVQRWGPNDGLPSSIVSGIIQTDDGFLWLGTLDGLARFDGIKFKAYMPQAFAGVRSNRIRLLVPSSSGGAWVVMDKGPIIRLEHGKVPRVISEGIPDIQSSAVEDRAGALWIGYQRGGSTN
jgi:ligand-binding sensor domain-containing protein